MPTYSNKNDYTNMTQAEILCLASLEGTENDTIIRQYLDHVASSFSPTEAFAIIAYIDTPDVLD